VESQSHGARLNQRQRQVLYSTSRRVPMPLAISSQRVMPTYCLGPKLLPTGRPTETHPQTRVIHEAHENPGSCSHRCHELRPFSAMEHRILGQLFNLQSAEYRTPSCHRAQGCADGPDHHGIVNTTSTCMYTTPIPWIPIRVGCPCFVSLWVRCCA
jgi:hypothetical protein